MKLAADANVLLSAIIGGQAARILRHPTVTDVMTTASVLVEVEEYAGVMARKRGLAEDIVLLAAASLPVTVIPEPVYRASISMARKRIGHRDPDDVDLLALALHFSIPIWSNDRDFEDGGVAWYTTAALLAKLG